jgi:hypothetical protein
MQFILTYEEARFLFEETGLERGRDLLGMTQLAGDIAWTTIVAMGIPAAAVALAGIWTARRARFVWLLGAMAFGYLALVMIPIAHMQLRYALLPAYLLSFPAAQWIVYAWNRPGRWRPVACAGGALAIAWMLAGAFNITYQMLFDARYEAGEWLSANLMSGQSVGFFGDRGQLPPIPEGVVVERFEGGDTARSDLEAAGVDLVLIVPDYTTPVGGERSLFLPADTYAALSEGLLPYASAAHFETEPPWGARGRGRGRYPFVNPPVRIFIRSQSREAGTSAPR